MKICTQSALEIKLSIENLKKRLDAASYISTKQAKKITAQLHFVIKKIDTLLKSSDPFSKGYLFEQKKEAVSLYGRCQNLIVDSRVIDLAKKAELLATLEASISVKKALLLGKNLKAFRKNHALSVENRKILRFAEILIDQFSQKQPEPLPLIDPIDFSVASLLYEIAEDYYLNRYHDQTLEKWQALAPSIQNRLQLLFEKYEAKEEKNAKKRAQIIIGLCDELTLFKPQFQLPSEKELSLIFSSRPLLNVDNLLLR